MLTCEGTQYSAWYVGCAHNGHYNYVVISSAHVNAFFFSYFSIIWLFFSLLTF